MKKTKTGSIICGFFLGIMVLLFSTALGLGVIHITDFPYAADIKALGISESSGLPQDEIMANYTAVMNFLAPLNNEAFDLPTLEYSATAVSHFEDCRLFFNIVYLLGAVAGLFLLLLIIKRKQITALLLKTAFTLTLAVPAVFCLALTISFDRAFVLFHEIFFDGSTWIFAPETDEIIKILPAGFFMHCSLVIAAFWVISAVVLFILSCRVRSSEK